MNLDEQLAEILAPLGVILEDVGAQQMSGEWDDETPGAAQLEPRPQRLTGAATSLPFAEEWATDEERAPAEISLFQTSREHYGVFYRLDLIAGLPHLRIFSPDEESALRMRCHLVRPSAASPMRAWFQTTRAHAGSPIYDEQRENTEQHLLFAAGEALKRLYWAGDPEAMRFPAEVDVAQLA